MLDIIVYYPAVLVIAVALINVIVVVSLVF